MGSKTAFLEQALTRHSFGRTLWTPPASWWVVLSLDPFDVNADGTSVNEVSASDYARLSVPNDATNFPAPSGAGPTTQVNGRDWIWPSVVAGWGTVQSIYLADSNTGGDLCFGTSLSVGVPLGAGSAFSVPAGAFVVRET